MQTGAPSLAKILTMVLFALSCFGLLLFLWLSFGGPIPFQPQGYRFRASFPNAQQLATQADVRIAGVSVGKVVAKSLDPQGNRTIATIQLDNQYAPIRQGARAILREKTIIGETYVEIAPGSPTHPRCPMEAFSPGRTFSRRSSLTRFWVRSTRPPAARSRSGNSSSRSPWPATTRT
jgi:phospholipid/cholesterol/gamma-HCH transport system substrate-binding protein